MTNKLRCLIVDDEYLARCLIKEYLSQHTDIEIIKECDNGVDAVDAINNENPDIIFLDIQMPLLNGLEVLAHSNRKQGVIFSTAYDQYALHAFDHNAVDYLLKPYSQERFNQALTKAKQQLHNSQPIAALLANSQPYLERILVKDRGKTHIISVKTIDYIEAEDDYIAIHTDGKSLLKTQRLSELEKQLDPQHFVRIHRSTLMRFSAMTALERTSKDTHTARLHTGISLNVSRAGYERLKQLLSTSTT